MARELYFGQVAGAFDARIARPGFDALLDDVNDRTKMAFAASWQSVGRFSEIGTVTAIGTWIPFVQTYDSIPNLELALARDGYIIRGYTDFTVSSAPPGVYNTGGSLYVAIVEQTRFMILLPTRYLSTTPIGDAIQYFVVQ